jgi:AraC-like DNA-binding protein
MVTPPLSIRIAYNERGHRIGETHHNAHISDLVVDLIRERHEDDAISYAAISRELSLSLSTVKKILTYQRRAQTPARYKAMVV